MAVSKVRRRLLNRNMLPNLRDLGPGMQTTTAISYYVTMSVACLLRI